MPKLRKFISENGLFNWTIGTELRHVTASLTFIAFDNLNFSVAHSISLEYCGCEQPGECNFDLTDKTGLRKSAF